MSRRFGRNRRRALRTQPVLIHQGSRFRVNGDTDGRVEVSLERPALMQIIKIHGARLPVTYNGAEWTIDRIETDNFKIGGKNVEDPRVFHLTLGAME